MSNIGTSNRTALRYVKETVFGTTPTAPNLKDIRYTSESINFTQNKITSNEIRADRNTSDLVTVGAEAAGDINIELSMSSFDEFIQAAFASAFSAPVSNISTLKNGTTLSSYTIQKHFQDLTTPVFQNFRGCRIGGMSLEFSSGSILTGSFSVMGLGAAASTSQIASATISAAPTDSVLNAVTNLVEIEEDGVTSTMVIKQLSLDLNNNLRGQDAIGTLGYIGIGLGRCEVSGNITAYFKDLTQYNKFLNNTSFALGFKCIDEDGNYYEFLLPNSKFESATIVSGGNDQDIMIEGTYRAIYDATEQCAIKCTRYYV